MINGNAARAISEVFLSFRENSFFLDFYQDTKVKIRKSGLVQALCDIGCLLEDLVPTVRVGISMTSQERLMHRFLSRGIRWEDG